MPALSMSALNDSFAGIWRQLVEQASQLIKFGEAGNPCRQGARPCLRHKVAEASSEGGFLGIGGVQVSDAEKATLGDIAKALGTSA